MYFFGMAGLVVLGQLGRVGWARAGAVPYVVARRGGGEGRRVVVGNDTGLDLVRLV